MPPTPLGDPFLPRHRLLAIVLGLLGIIVVLGGIAVAALLTIDFRPIIERDASRALQRRLAIGGLEIGWGNPLRLELRDVRLANMPGGSEPDMLTIGHLAADIDVWPLLHGVLRYDRLRLERARILLERDASGAPNWRIGASGAPAASGFALVPKNRTQFPTLLDLVAQSSTLVYRVPQHPDLTLTFNELRVRSAGDDQKVTLALTGDYNGVAARVDVSGGSFATMRDAAIPYPAEVTLEAGPATSSFKGTVTEPLDFDGVKGMLELDTPSLGEALKIVGAAFPVDVPFHLAGAFDKTGEHWHLGGAKGALASSSLAGTLDLTEGPRGGADALALDLTFPLLDLKPLIAGSGGGTGSGGTSLRLDEHPGITIDARISTKLLANGTLRLADVTFEGATKPGAATVRALSFALAGGEVTAKGSAQSVPGGGSRIAADLTLSGAEAEPLLHLLGAEPGQVTGRVDGGVALEMTGATLGEALPTSGGQAVLAMSRGKIARSLVEKASTDLHALFRTGQGFAQISCLIGIAAIEKGVALVSPLRLRTPETTFAGGGTIGLATQRLDLTVKTEGTGLSVFALKLPLHIGGTLSQPAIGPQLGAAIGLAAATRATTAQHLVPALQPTAAGNPCLR